MSKLTLESFKPGDPIWYTVNGVTHPGTVVKMNWAERTLTAVTRRENGDGVYYAYSVVGLYAIGQGRFYRRDDGEVIAPDAATRRLVR